MLKNTMRLLSVLIVLSFLAACAPAVAPTTEPVAQPTEAPAQATEAPAQPTEAAAPAKQLTVAVVAGGQIGDNGFIDSANGGLQRMEKELGIKTIIIQSGDDASRYLDDMTSAAEQADVIFAIPGYFFDEQLKQVVPQFPGKTFVYVDGKASLPEMASVTFLQNEGAFLAGALAALMTTRTDALAKVDAAKVVGFMGGADMPVIHDYQVGFNQGAKYAVPDVEVINQYAGTHFDPAKGKETALAMYAKGADIIFEAAGPTGLGVFEAGKDAQKYVIGVDSNQKGLAPDWVLASMRKNVGDSIFDFIKMFQAGQVKAGEVYAYGISKGGVGIDYGGMDPDLVPQDVKDKIAEFSQKIENGEITVDVYTGE